ncbi:minor tail protein [Microbacterium phage Tyrumbra]|uniref:Minor tail protein n=1 Tax=Microbacterium phage Tyrumbra TaxID=2596974 RepID=A0A516KPF8_9CAUD|nr:minor tail protein [Microbacterium phage Tyrumbra]QDP43572.1 minor tail protein [Microbacterium phage Tyrumbra]
MLDEYLALGGVELGNNARAYDYASCLSCCAGLLKLPGCDGIHDATTGFTDAVREWQDRFTNLFPNPSFETASGTVEVARNLILNPRFTNLDGWGFIGSTAVDLGGGVAEVTISATPPTSNFITPNLTSAFAGFVAGDRFSASYTVQNVGTTPGTFRLATYDGTSYIYGNAITVNPGETKDISAIGQTALAGVQYMQPRLHANVVAGGKFRVSKAIAVKSSVLPSYFDPVAGTGDPDLTATWAGAANNSATIMTGVGIASVSSAASAEVIMQSTAWSSTGSKSARIRPTSPNTGVSFVVLRTLTAADAGKTFTVKVKVRMTAPSAVTAAYARSFFVTANAAPTTIQGPQTPNVAGVHDMEWSFTVPAGTTNGTVRWYHGGSASDPDIWLDDLAIIPGTYSGGYFDGENLPESLDETEWRTRWSAGANASTSILQEDVVVTEAESAEPPYSCADIALAPWYDQTNPFSRDFAGYYLLSVTGATDGTMTAGVTESVGYGGVIGSPHYATRSVRVRSMLVGCGRAATHYGLAWLKAALGESFCSRHGDACGTSDLSFFIDCPPVLDPGDTDYAATTSPYRRYLHDVACTSSPIIQEEYETPSGAYVVIVEYILTAESPFVWGETVEAESTGSVLTAFDDIPYNLMRRPSGEQGDGIPAIVATQYAYNGSAEYGGSATTLPTGWVMSQASIPAGLTVAKSTDIAAVGPNSARARLLATGAVAGGTLWLSYDVPLAPLPAGSAPSVSMWAAALTFAGAPTHGNLSGFIEWRTDTATILTVPLGNIPANGGNISATGLSRPAGATVARLIVGLYGINAAAGDDLRLYADAFGLTVP